MHDELYELKEKLMKELEEYSGNSKFSKEDVEAIKYITSAIDHICNISAEMEDGYSSRSYEGGGNSRRSSYRSRGSYARRRDNMGRYSSNGYSRAFDTAEELRGLMQDAPEAIRSDIQRLINKAEQMG